MINKNNTDEDILQELEGLRLENELLKISNSELTRELEKISLVKYTDSEITNTIAFNEDSTITKLSKAVEQSPVSIVITDRNGDIEYVNPKFTTLTGYSREEVYGKNPRILKSGYQSPEIYKDLWSTIITGKEWRGQFQNKKKNGDFYWESISISPLKNSQGEVSHFIAVKEDITERRRIEAEILQKNAELSELNASKDKFFSIIAHDLKNPLVGFLGWTEIMAHDTEDYTIKEWSELGYEMNRSANNLLKLLTNLLEWAEMQKGSLRYQPKMLSITDLIDENIENQKMRCDQKGITIVNSIDSPLSVFADERMVSSILRNLLSNAIKFTSKDGEIKVDAKKPEDNSIEISVGDSGIGMPESLSNKLFKMDEQVGRPGTEGEESSGLGLLLCKEFVERNGGKIRVESVEGVGTTFYFTLHSKE